MPTICLNMIVRNEGHVIGRCLESVKPYIDHWVIADTGSNDNTVEVIEETLSDIPGELHKIDFDDYVSTRNRAFELTHDSADYVLLIDPDMTLSVSEEGFKDGLELDGYYVKTEGNPRSYNLRLVHSAFAWAHIGAINEFLVSRDAKRIEKLDALSVVHHEDGREHQVRTDTARQLLEAALESDPNDNHALFNLGRHCFQNQQWRDAIDFYQRFLGCDSHWDEEWVWHARYQIAMAHELLNSPESVFVQAYLDAYLSRPVRAEPLYQLGRYYRERENYLMAEIYAGKAMEMDLPGDLFELDTMVYKWSLPVEHSLICYRLGRHDRAVRSANRALDERLVERNSRDMLVNSRQRSLEWIYKFRMRPTRNPMTENRIVVVVPFHNASDYLESCIQTLIRQDYTNFRATFIDDASTDDSGTLVPAKDERFVLVRNQTRVGPLVNRTQCILNCDENDIVVYLDGDDQLASDGALSHINLLYNVFDCWMTYGQFLTQNGNLGWAVPFATPRDFMEAMELGNIKFPIHPITHRAGLLHRLKDYDPELESFKDKQGEWLFYASDAVMARPLFLLAGWDRVIYNNRVLYLYTEGHEISESIQNKDDQIEACRIANSKFRPPRISSYSKIS